MSKSVFSVATEKSLKKHVLFGAFLIVGGLGGLTAASAIATISGAVIAPGQIMVESNAKKVQHQEGGIVARLDVAEGARVRAGERLIRLDDTVHKANLMILRRQMDELLAQEARLVAERDGLPSIAFQSEMLSRATEDEDTLATMRGQQTVFATRRAALSGRQEQVREQMRQFESNIEALSIQKAARQREVELIGQELAGVQALFAKNMVPITRFIALQRDKTRIEGEVGKLAADMATAKGSIAEKAIELLRLDTEFQATVARDLSETRAKLAETAERHAAAQDKLARIDIRAPQSGQVHALSVHTIGGVLSPAEVAMVIVPDHDRLIIEAQVEPADIDEVHNAQKASLRFSGFADRIGPDTTGEVIAIAPDLVEEPQTRRRFYKIRIAAAAPLGHDGKPLPLVPGMPVEVFLSKGDRTILSYLMKPMRDQLRRVFRE
jgi:HlyD family secretion protein